MGDPDTPDAAQSDHVVDGANGSYHLLAVDAGSADALAPTVDRLLVTLEPGTAVLLALSGAMPRIGPDDIAALSASLLTHRNRGVILVISAPDESTRMTLVQNDVDRIAPVRTDLADARVILNRMISI